MFGFWSEKFLNKIYVRLQKCLMKKRLKRLTHTYLVIITEFVINYTIIRLYLVNV